MSELRYAAAAAMGLIAGATVIGFAPVTQGPPDVAVRSIDLAATAAGLAAPEIAEFENLIRESLDGGAGGAREDLGFGQTQADTPDSSVIDPKDLDPTLTEQDALDSLTSQNLLEGLYGGGLDTSSLIQEPPELADVTAGAGDAAIIAPGVGASGATSAASMVNVASAAYSAASVAFADIVPALQGSYDALTAGIAAAELDFNGQLVGAQTAAADQLFGEGTLHSDIAKAAFSASNSNIGEHEAALNQLLGVNLSANELHSSLTANFDPEILSQAAAAQAVSPEDISDILSGLQPADLGNLVTDVNWVDIVIGFFSGLF